MFCEMTANAQENNGAAYDSVLAKKYGADDYGMKTYVMAFLKKGPNRSQDSVTAKKILKGHLDNIQRLADEGKLVVAGPFMDGGDLSGIFIFDVRTIEEARALTNTDPAVQAGRLTAELKEFYCSAALLAIPELHKKVKKMSMF
jgi:uncharacterized protein YciI